MFLELLEFFIEFFWNEFEKIFNFLDYLALILEILILLESN